MATSPGRSQTAVVPALPVTSEELTHDPDREVPDRAIVAESRVVEVRASASDMLVRPNDRAIHAIVIV